MSGLDQICSHRPSHNPQTQESYAHTLGLKILEADGVKYESSQQSAVSTQHSAREHFRLTECKVVGMVHNLPVLRRFSSMRFENFGAYCAAGNVTRLAMWSWIQWASHHSLGSI